MTETLKIIADAHIWGAEQAFASLAGHDVKLRLLESRDITAAAVRDADILLTRSSTRVDAELLASSRVRFAATATIGDDHYDKAWLKRRRIAFANAAGSSTGSVIEYMMTVLVALHAKQLLSIPDCRIGIIGAGRIGGRLWQRCRSLGMRTLVNDPPRARREGRQAFAELDELLDTVDVLTLHTPLTCDGQDATRHLINKDTLNRFRGTGIINAARGACIDNEALLAWLEADPRHFAVLDCWEHEPAPSRRLLAHPGLAIATPHIAGHSLDGKAANTVHIYHALCKWLDIPPAWDWQQQLPEPPVTAPIACGNDPWHNIMQAILALCPVHRDHAMMKAWADLDTDELREHFTRYRRHYPVRRAWRHCQVRLEGADHATRKLADAIGLACV